MNSIFISYSHKDKEWVVNWLMPRLESAGLRVHIDFRDFKIGTPAVVNMERAVKDCWKTFLVITSNWLNSEWTGFESLLLQTKDPIGKKECIIPLMLERCDLPERLSIFTYADFTSQELWETELARILTQIKNSDALETEAGHPQRGAPTIPRRGGPPCPPENLTLPAISTAKLPVTGKEVFGREKELELLNKAWADPQIVMLTLVAWGGVGKSALVNHWLNNLEKQNYCGAARVYGWSFYSQGAEEGKQASADEFLHETLQWYGDPDPKAGSNVEKGRRLAALIRKEKTLLILDGMEPLQYPPGEPREGSIKDPGLKTMVRDLAASNQGLVVITTRESVTDVQDKTGGLVQEILLENLSIEAGAHLLKCLGVTGGERDLAEAVKEYGGHALALTLLGNYVRTRYKGDLRQRDKIPALTVDKKKGEHARRVMAAYEEWYKIYPKSKFLRLFKRFIKVKPELNILRLMGLFDRPVEKGAVEALTAPGQKPIPGITGSLAKLKEADWDYALDNLRGAGLLAKADPHKPGVLDCHPLVREHFAEKLRQENPEGWKTAHQRLYEYYKALPEKEEPDTLEEMEPLLAAVAHGCAAGLYQEVRDDVFWPRILRGNEFYIIHKLGAFGSFLAALSHFFQEPWSLPAEGLIDVFKAFVLNGAGFGLRALGRLHEALQPMKACLDYDIQHERWLFAAKAAGNLSELHLTLGQVDQAVNVARQAVRFADQSKNWEVQMIMRTTLADSLHQQGKLEAAETWFRETEALQKKRQPEYPYLYSLQGFRFCDLLLGQGKYKEVLERAAQTLAWATPHQLLLAIALDRLSLGRAYMMETLAESPGDFSNAGTYLAQAVEGLRKAGQQQYLTPGLIVRAELFRHQQKYEEAWTDLQEAEEIAHLGDMRLHLADYHLEAARLSDAEGKKEEAQTHRNEAKKLIEETGYGRRKF